MFSAYQNTQNFINLNTLEMKEETDNLPQNKALNIGVVMPSSCIFNEQRRAIIKETESFYFFAVGNRFKWNYAEKHLCAEFKYSN